VFCEERDELLLHAGPLSQVFERVQKVQEHRQYCRALLFRVAGSACYHLGCMMHAVHLRLTMRRFTLLLASALEVGFGGTACGVGHFAYVGFASRSLNKCLVLPWLSDLVAK
jgi:hypothetical protein